MIKRGRSLQALLAAAVACLIIASGVFAMTRALELPGRCQCETQGWGVWDWEYWYFECHTPRPPECDPV